MAIQGTVPQSHNQETTRQLLHRKVGPRSPLELWKKKKLRLVIFISFTWAQLYEE